MTEGRQYRWRTFRTMETRGTRKRHLWRGGNPIADTLPEPNCSFYQHINITIPICLSIEMHKKRFTRSNHHPPNPTLPLPLLRRLRVRHHRVHWLRLRLRLLVGHALWMSLIPLRRQQLRLLRPILHLSVHLSDAARRAAQRDLPSVVSEPSPLRHHCNRSSSPSHP